MTERHQSPTAAPASAGEPALSKADLLYIALFAALFLFVFRAFFFTDCVFFERDTTLVEIPAKKLTVQLLREGNFALWTDAYGNGQPFLANPKNAVFYPTTWLYLVLPFLAAFKLHYLIHVILGWLGLYILGRSYAQSRPAAFLGASLFASSGMYLSSFEFYNHIAALAWMPWILWLLHREAVPWRKRLVLLAGLWALMILAGAPEFVLMTLLMALGQAFFTPGDQGRKIVRAVLPLALAVFVSAAQVLPSIELLRGTDRSVHARQWPLELVQLLNLPFPNVLGNDRQPGHNDLWGEHLFDQQSPLYYSLYWGFGALAFALLGLRRPRGRPRTILLVLALLFFLLACGRYSPFFFLYRFMPLLSSIRYPVKFLMGSIFCVSILSGFGLDRLVSGEGRRPGRTWPLAAAAAALGLLAFMIFRRPVIDGLNVVFAIDREASLRELERSLVTGLGMLVVYALAIFLVRRSARPARVWIGALLAMAVIDPALHNQFVNPTVPASAFESPFVQGLPSAPLTVFRDETQLPSLKESLGDEVRLHRFYRQSLYPFTGIGEGIRYALNWDFYGTYPRSYLELCDAVRSLPPDKRLRALRAAGCAVSLGLEPAFSKAAASRRPIEGIDLWLEPVPGAQTVPFVVFRAMAADRIMDRLRLLTADGFDPLQTVITDRDLGLSADPGSGPGGPGAVTVRSVSQDGGRYALSLPREGVAVFPGNAGPGWRAWVDGRRAEVFEADLFSRGVRIPAGEHEVVLRYRPSSFIWGVAISLVSWAALGAGAWISGRRSRRRGLRASS